MYGCECWTIKEAEHWRTDAFELCCWRRLLRVPWTARRSNQSILKEISPEYSFEGLMLKLKLQYCGHLMQTDSFEKTLMLGKTEGRRRRGWQRMRRLDGITDSMEMSLSQLWELVMTRRPGVLQSMGTQRVGHLSDWTELNWIRHLRYIFSGSQFLKYSNPNTLEVFQFSSVAQLCPTLWDPMDCSTPGLPVHHQLPEFTQTHVYWVGDAIQPSHPLSSPSPPTFNLSQHQGLFKKVSSLHQVAKVLEFQLSHHSFQWMFRTDFLLDWISLLSKGLSRVFSNTRVQKH